MTATISDNEERAAQLQVEAKLAAVTNEYHTHLIDTTLRSAASQVGAPIETAVAFVSPYARVIPSEDGTKSKVMMMTNTGMVSPVSGMRAFQSSDEWGYLFGGAQPSSAPAVVSDQPANVDPEDGRIDAAFFRANRERLKSELGRKGTR